MGGDPDDPERGRDGGEREGERDEGRDQRAEDEQEDHDRDRDGNQLATDQVLVDDRLQVLVDGGLARQVGGGAIDAADGRAHLLDAHLRCPGLERRADRRVDQIATGLDGTDLGAAERRGGPLCGRSRLAHQSRCGRLPVLGLHDEHERRIAALAEVALEELQHLGRLRVRDVEAI